MPINKELIAPCGLYCEVCPLYMAGKDEAMRKELAEKWQAPEEMMQCVGCRPAKGSPTPLRGEVCPNYTCAEEKGHVLCGDCGDFPCDMLTPCAQFAEAIPHNTKVFSLMRIKRDGLEQWAADYPVLQQKYFQGKMVIGKGPQLPEDEK